MNPRRTMIVAAICICAVIVWSERANADDETPTALLARVFEAAPDVPFIAKATLTIAGGFVRELDMYYKDVEGSGATYVEVTSPLNLKGTRFLFFERTTGSDEQYIYLPSMRRAIQVVDETRRQPFLGSDFYVSDLVSPNLDAYEFEFSGAATIGKRECKLIDAVPTTGAGDLYSKIVLAVDSHDLLIIRSEFFDPKGRRLKEWTIEEAEKVDGHWTARRQKMKNVQQKTESLLELRTIEYDAEVDDRIFTQAYLRR